MKSLALVIVVPAALVAAASVARAGPDRYFGPPSYKPQTWEDIARDREEIQRIIQQQHHPGSPNTAAFSDYVLHSSHQAVGPR